MQNTETLFGWWNDFKKQLDGVRKELKNKKEDNKIILNSLES